MRTRGFEVVKGYEDKDIHLPVRGTKHAAGYDIEAAEDIVIPIYEKGIKPTLVPTGLKAYCMDDECIFLLNRSSGPKILIIMVMKIMMDIFILLSLTVVRKNYMLRKVM